VLISFLLPVLAVEVEALKLRESFVLTLDDDLAEKLKMVKLNY
jgi:hypothetical protein